MNYFDHEARLKREDFYPQLHSLRKGYRVIIWTMRLKKFASGDGATPEAAIEACEADLRALLADPQWRNFA